MFPKGSIAAIAQQYQPGSSKQPKRMPGAEFVEQRHPASSHRITVQVASIPN